jgi:glycosyltransferase involved in cell wall biosynthesis
VVCASFDPSYRHGHLRWRAEEDIPVIELMNNWRCRTFRDTYESAVVTEQIEHVLQAVQPDVVHIHSLLNLSFALPARAHARGIPVVATLHDYSIVCPSGGQRIHQADNHLCDAIDPRRCARCFRESPFYSQMSFTAVTALTGSSPLLARWLRAARMRVPQLAAWASRAVQRAALIPVTEQDIAERLVRARDVFQHVDLFVAPSRSIASEFLRLGLDESRLRVSDYGVSHVQALKRDPVRRPVRLGYVGSLIWHKGVHTLLDAVRQLPRDGYRLRLYGDPWVSSDYSAALRNQAVGLPVTFMGAFDRAQVSDVYAGIDVLVVPSIWLENSPLVIHEAFMAGVPIVGARIGGVKDLIADGVNGLLYDPRSPAELSQVLRRLVEQPDRIRQLADGVTNVKSVSHDAEEWEKRYADVMTHTPHGN